jgi:site-specific DNA recombinase
MRNAVAYVRVSTEGQVDKFGIDSQKEMIVKYAKEHDYAIREWFIDGGVSGAKDIEERPELNRLIYGAVMNPPVEAVIVAKSDRVARDIYLYFAIRREFQKRDVELVSVTEDFGALGAMAPVLEAMMAAIAQVERDNIRSRTSGGRKIKAYAGGYCGGNTPYGYVSGGDGSMQIDPEEADTVREIFRLKGEGCSLRRISDLLRINGHTTRNGNAFSPSTIKSILDNRKVYEGYYKYGSMEWTKGQHEAILEVDE